jgi:predicted Zn-ribbon and HTH transcriptional regulator
MSWLDWSFHRIAAVDRPDAAAVEQDLERAAAKLHQDTWRLTLQPERCWHCVLLPYRIRRQC